MPPKGRHPNFFFHRKFLNLDILMILDHVCRQFYAILVTINMVRGTEVYDGLKSQEKYLRKDATKKILFVCVGLSAASCLTF